MSDEAPKTPKRKTATKPKTTAKRETLPVVRSRSASEQAKLDAITKGVYHMMSDRQHDVMAEVCDGVGRWLDANRAEIIAAIAKAVADRRGEGR